MIRIYGIGASNYSSCVKTVLLEKNIAFEDIIQFPSQDADVIAHSPMGKVPYIEINGRYLSETNVIYDYLEETHSEHPLYPENSLKKAQVKEIIRIVELYLDAPARRHIGTAVFGEQLNQNAFDEVRPAIEKGLNAFLLRAKLAPYVAGNEFTYADISSFFMLGFTNFHTKEIYDWDLTTSYPQIGEYLNFIGQRPTISSIQKSLENSLMEIINSTKERKQDK